MKPLQNFEEFVKQGIVKKVKPDLERAKSLILESERKMISLKERLEKIGVKDENANDYIEYCYDIIMLLIRAKLYSKGYNSSGLRAHEAEIAYLSVIGFEENDVQFANKLRYFRNGILYYGSTLDKEYADKVINFTNKNYLKLKKS